MAIVQKDMGSLKVAAGILKVTLFYDDSIISNASHIPSAAACLKEIGDVNERIEDEIGVIECGDMNLSLKDDYTNYASGVWWKLLQGEVQFRFYLDEGAGDTYLFWGKCLPASSTVQEHAVINPGTSGMYIRTYDILLLNILVKLKEVSVADVVSEILANDVIDFSSSPSKCFITFRKLFGCFLRKAYGAAVTDVVNSVQFPSGDHDIQFYDGTNWKNIFDLYIITVINADNAQNEIKSPYFDSAHNLYYGNRFANALELFGHLCRSFGYLPRFYYGQTDETINGSTDLYRVFLSNRGRVGNLVTFNSNEKRPADVEFSTTLKAGSQSIGVYRTNGNEGVGSSSAELLIELDFHYLDTTTTENWEKIYYNNGAGYLPVTNSRFYNYAENQYRNKGTAPYNVYPSINQLYHYYMKRFTGNMRRTRVYKSLKAEDSTTSHRHVHPLRRTQIHDGDANRTFYANEVIKNVVRNELTIQWLEE